MFVIFGRLLSVVLFLIFVLLMFKGFSGRLDRESTVQQLARSLGVSVIKNVRIVWKCNICRNPTAKRLLWEG